MMINKKIYIYFFPALIIILNAAIKPAEANLNHKDLRDPFHSFIEVEEKMKDNAAENDEKEIQVKEGLAKREEEMMVESIEQEISEKLRKIEIAGFFGENKKYFVLFKGDSRIYKEKDHLDTDKKIKIDKIDVDLVDLVVELGNGKRLYKKILFKIK